MSISGNTAFPGTVEATENSGLTIRRAGVLEFQTTTTGHTASFRKNDTTVLATLTSNSEFDLSNGSLRLPIRTTLSPSARLFGSPVEGEMIIYNNTTAGWARLAVYLNGAWRLSSNL